MKNWISIIIDQNGIEEYNDFGLGLDINIHKHMYGDSEHFHFHICLTLAFWFIELQIGYDNLEE